MAPKYFEHGPVLIVAAHPDDETIGLGGQLSALQDPYIIHVTDGAPLSTANPMDYAAVRRKELAAAMDLAGVGLGRCLELGASDQRSSFSLVPLTHLLYSPMIEIQPAVVFTHPYEGGHPDHDACAFIVQAAVGMIPLRKIKPPLRVEFTSYHNANPNLNCHSMKVGEFLPGPPVSTLSLSMSAQSLKQKMFDCFKTQQQIIREFSTAEERFRTAPYYDFATPPHPGKLYYEDKGWGVTSGLEWRRLAKAAADALSGACSIHAEAR